MSVHPCVHQLPDNTVLQSEPEEDAASDAASDGTCCNDEMDALLADELAKLDQPDTSTVQQPPPEQPAREIQRGQQVEEHEEHGWGVHCGSHNPPHTPHAGSTRQRAKKGACAELSNG